MSAVIPGRAEHEPGISRFRVRAKRAPRNDNSRMRRLAAVDVCAPFMKVNSSDAIINAVAAISSGRASRWATATFDFAQTDTAACQTGSGAFIMPAARRTNSVSVVPGISVLMRMLLSA